VRVIGHHYCVGGPDRFLESQARSDHRRLGQTADEDEPGVTLIGPTVVLRVPTDDDAEPLWTAARETAAGLRAWMGWFDDAYSVDRARSWVAAVRRGWVAGEEFGFVVTARGAGAVLGACGLNQLDWPHRRANLGYWVRASASGRGVATESAALVAHWGLGDLELQRLEIAVATTNAASLRVAAKLGAVAEGVARHRFLLQGRPVDGSIFSLVASDLDPDADDGGRRQPG
jgi:ribosomal-protein-serine acetyltransferase